MPKTEPHFDVAALCEQVLEQDLGLIVSTNNAGGFRRIVYAHARRHPEHRLHIYADPLSADRFFLLRSPPEGALDEPRDIVPPPGIDINALADDIAADFISQSLGGPDHDEES